MSDELILSTPHARTYTHAKNTHTKRTHLKFFLTTLTPF